MRRTLLLIVLTGVALAGCSSSHPTRGDAARTSGGVTTPEALTGGGDGGQTVAPGAASADNASTAVPDAPAAGPRIVKKADLTVDVRRNALRPAVDRATSIAERHGGYIASTAVSHGDDGSSGTLTVRIPAAQFDAVRRELSTLGTVEDERVSGDDVTAQLVDYAARITSLQAQEDALRTLMGRANAIGEVLQVQGQLFDVRRQIEQLQGQQKSLADAADFSTITMRLTEPGAPGRDPTSTTAPRTGLARSVDRAWDAAVAVVGAFIVVVGVAVPLAALAVLAWILWHIAVRRVRPHGAGATSPAP
jgi:hypothetical protein